MLDENAYISVSFGEVEENSDAFDSNFILEEYRDYDDFNQQLSCKFFILSGATDQIFSIHILP